MIGGPTGRVRRIGWGIADQAVSSLTNMLCLLLIARTVGPEDFGGVAIVAAVVPVALSIGRGMWGEASLIVARGGAERERLDAGGALAGAALTGVVLAGALASAAWVTDEPVRGPLVALALAVPFVLVQDTSRYVRFGERRPHFAFASDLGWLLGSVALLSVAEGRAEGAGVLVGLWLFGSVFGLPTGAGTHRPRVGRALQWVSEGRRTWVPLTGDLVGGTAFRAAAVTVVVAIAGLADGGGFRAAQLLMGPITVVTVAAAPLYLTEATATAAVRSAAMFAAGVGAVATAWLGVLLVVPDGLGEAVLGDVWGATASLVLPVGSAHVLSVVALAPFLVLRASGQTNRSFLLRVLSGTVLVGAAVVGAVLGGARGAAWAMAAAEAISALVGFALCADRSGARTRVRLSGRPFDESRNH